MPCKITNVSLDPAFELKRRQASRLQMEPVIAGERLRLRQSRVLTDEQYVANKDWLAENERNGVIRLEMTGDAVPVKPTSSKKEPEAIASEEIPTPPAPPPPTPEEPPLPPPPPVEIPPSEPAPMSSQQNMGQGQSRKDEKKRGR